MPCRDVGHLILSAGWLRELGIVLLCLCVHEAGPRHRIGT